MVFDCLKAKSKEPNSLLPFPNVRPFSLICSARLCLTLLLRLGFAEWNKYVLLHCHGCRPVGIPLVADLDVKDGLYAELIQVMAFCFDLILVCVPSFHCGLVVCRVQAGWVVGMSSYRREGLIVRDAMSDVDNLREFVVRQFGAPTAVLLEVRCN
jgi:hypothetical protein